MFNVLCSVHYVINVVIPGIGPDLTTENLLQSIAAALHLNNSSPVVGQSQSAAKFAKNPTVYINTTQPLIQVGSTLPIQQTVSVAPQFTKVYKTTCLGGWYLLGSRTHRLKYSICTCR